MKSNNNESTLVVLKRLRKTTTAHNNNTHPIPESKHVLRVNAKLADALGVGRKRRKVLGDRTLVAPKGVEDPLFGRPGVGHGFLRRKGLGGDQTEGGGGIALLQDLGNVRAVHVGAKVHLQIALGVRFEGLADHDGSKVAAANANVDNVPDALPGVALPRARADLFRKGLDAGERVLDGGHDVLTVHVDGIGGAAAGRCLVVAQGNVEDGASFGVVDLVALVHGLGLVVDVLLFGEFEKEVKGGFRDAVLAEIQQDVFELGRELVEASGVFVKEIFHLNIFHGFVVGLKGRPSGRGGEIGHGFRFLSWGASGHV